jgi:hypothetical protein
MFPAFSVWEYGSCAIGSIGTLKKHARSWFHEMYGIDRRDNITKLLARNLGFFIPNFSSPRQQLPY